MKPRLHRCAATHCQAQVPLHLLMCVDHWRMVPAPLRREVLAAWREVGRAIDPADQHDARLAHGQAVARAVEAVSTKAELKQARRADLAGDLFAREPQHNNDETHGDSTQQGGRAQA